MGQQVCPRGASCVAMTDDPRQLVLDALQLSEGNILKTAWLLGLDRSVLYEKIKELNLTEEVTMIRRAAKVNNGDDRIGRLAHSAPRR